MPKRYVLFFAKSDLSEDDLRRFSDVVRGWHQTAKIISVKGNRKAVIVKTTNRVAPVLRNIRPGIKVSGTELVCVLTSGAIGNLKKRASEAAVDGKVP
jgi:hypothetical protein